MFFNASVSEYSLDREEDHGKGIGQLYPDACHVSDKYPPSHLQCLLPPASDIPKSIPTTDSVMPGLDAPYLEAPMTGTT